MVIELITQDNHKVSGHDFVGQSISAGLNRWWRMALESTPGYKPELDEPGLADSHREGGK
jgi:hypothetical protein